MAPGDGTSGVADLVQRRGGRASRRCRASGSGRSGMRRHVSVVPIQAIRSRPVPRNPEPQSDGVPNDFRVPGRIVRSSGGGSMSQALAVPGGRRSDAAPWSDWGSWPRSASCSPRRGDALFPRDPERSSAGYWPRRYWLLLRRGRASRLSSPAPSSSGSARPAPLSKLHRALGASTWRAWARARDGRRLLPGAPHGLRLGFGAGLAGLATAWLRDDRPRVRRDTPLASTSSTRGNGWSRSCVGDGGVHHLPRALCGAERGHRRQARSPSG